MKRNPRVFVTQENSQLNYSHAEAFGEIVFLTRDEVSPVPGSLTNSAIMDELAEKLADFDFESDFIVPSGSPTVCGMAFFTICRGLSDWGPASRRPKQLRVLRWSNRDRIYQPITLPINV